MKALVLSVLTGIVVAGIIFGIFVFAELTTDISKWGPEQRGGCAAGMGAAIILGLIIGHIIRASFLVDPEDDDNTKK